MNKYEYLINVKNSENISNNLSELIPDIIGSKGEGYLLDTIFVLYFIILYEFYYDIFKKINQNFEKSGIIRTKCSVGYMPDGYDHIKSEIEEISNWCIYGRITIYHIIKEIEFLGGLKFLLLYEGKSTEPAKIFSNGNYIDDVIVHYDIVLNFIGYIHYYIDYNFNYSLGNFDYYSKKEEYYKSLASEYPFTNLFKMAETLL